MDDKAANEKRKQQEKEDEWWNDILLPAEVWKATKRDKMMAEWKQEREENWQKGGQAREDEEKSRMLAEEFNTRRAEGFLRPSPACIRGW